MKAFFYRFLWLSISVFLIQSSFCDQLSINELCVTSTYQKVLDMALAIWSGLYDLQRGVVTRKLHEINEVAGQDYGSFLDLTVGRMMYVQRLLMIYGDDIGVIPLDDMRYFERVIDYIQEDAEHLLLYDAQRAGTIDQLLRDIKEQLARIIDRTARGEKEYNVNMQS